VRGWRGSEKLHRRLGRRRNAYCTIPTAGTPFADLLAHRIPQEVHEPQCRQSPLCWLATIPRRCATRGPRGVDQGDDLLEALIREDQGEAAAIMSKGHPNVPPVTDRHGIPIPFFSKDEAQALLAAMEKPGRGDQDLSVDMPLAGSVKAALVAAFVLADKKGHWIIEPLHLLAVIVEDRESPLAKLLHGSGISTEGDAGSLKAGRERCAQRSCVVPRAHVAWTTLPPKADSLVEDVVSALVNAGARPSVARKAAIEASRPNRDFESAYRGSLQIVAPITVARKNN
jgi:hypothetical protein